MGRPTEPVPSVTLQVLRELSARRDSRPEIEVPALPDAAAAEDDGAPQPPREPAADEHPPR